jgi:hypothetical protein
VFTARYALSPYIKQIRFVFKGLIFITEVESVYSAVRTDSLYKTDTLRFKGLIIITQVESVYSAVRTESLYKTDTLRLILHTILQD